MAKFALPPEQLERLGKVPDHVIAKECYVSKQLIGQIRRSMGIKSCYKAYWYGDRLERLVELVKAGKTSFDIAVEMDCSINSIKCIRQKIKRNGFL